MLLFYKRKKPYEPSRNVVAFSSECERLRIKTQHAMGNFRFDWGKNMNPIGYNHTMAWRNVNRLLFNRVCNSEGNVAIADDVFARGVFGS